MGGMATGFLRARHTPARPGGSRPVRACLRAIAVLGLLAGCSTAPQGTGGALPALAKTPIRMFAPQPVQPVLRGNDQIARDFLDLSFRLESGTQFPVLTRFEGPIRLRIAGQAAQTTLVDLDRLLDRLRREAAIDIRRSTQADAQITLHLLPRASLRRVVPQAACFVVPNVRDLADYARNRRAPRTNWATLTKRQNIAIFVPNDQSPQELRDCLHEEIAQAIGPLNDLYRLPDSVFNDDNFHTVLTGFDMLILRAYYDPALRNGMTRAQVAARLPAILNRLNPQRGRSGTQPTAPTPRSWITAMETALGPDTFAPRRRRAADQAVALATQAGWQDGRTGFAYYAQGRLALPQNAETALSSFLTAQALFARSPLTQIHSAHVSAQLAAFTLSMGRWQETDALIARAEPIARRSENAALLSTLLMFRAAALEAQGQTNAAASIWQEAIGWGRYGLGDGARLRTQIREIKALAPVPARAAQHTGDPS